MSLTKIPQPAPTQQFAEGLQRGLQQYVEDIMLLGYVVTIDTEPTKPLTMGKYVPKVNVRLSNEAYRGAGKN